MVEEKVLDKGGRKSSQTGKKKTKQSSAWLDTEEEETVSEIDSNDLIEKVAKNKRQTKKAEKSAKDKNKFPVEEQELKETEKSGKDKNERATNKRETKEANKKKPVSRKNKTAPKKLKNKKRQEPEVEESEEGESEEAVNNEIEQDVG